VEAATFRRMPICCHLIRHPMLTKSMWVDDGRSPELNDEQERGTHQSGDADGIRCARIPCRERIGHSKPRPSTSRVRAQER
jgi:hypothetical protein